MTKQAEFAISAVRFNAENTHIDKVKAAPFDGAMFGAIEEHTRQDVLEALHAGIKIFTIFENGLGGWTLGADVLPAVIDNVIYIKTAPDETAQDNLDNLRTF